MQPSIQRIGAVSRLTTKAAFRFKLIPWLLLTIGLAITTIPYLIRHDGTAEMFARVQLSYSLIVAGILLAASTLWLSCGILAQDIEKHYISLITSKPIARWEIWLGRWIGIFALNSALITLVGIGVFGILLLHSKKLSPEEQKQLNQVVLTSRTSVSEEPPDEEKEINLLFERRTENMNIDLANESRIRERLKEEVRWMNQLVKPLYRRIWSIPIEKKFSNKNNETLQIQVKFYSSPDAEITSFPMTWLIGDPKSPTRWEKNLDLTPMTTHEWSIPANLITPDGYLNIECQNYTDLTIVFKIEDGLRVLYKDGSFLANYCKALLIILSWLGLISALGLWAATFASLPVATFLISTIFLVVGSGGLFELIATEGTISTYNEDTGKGNWNYLDWLLVPLFTVLYQIVEILRSISPIDRLVTGQSIQTQEWLAYLTLIGSMLITPFSFWGMFLLTRKELKGN